MFDVSKLVLGEVAKVEELSGQSISVMGDDTAPKGKMMAALAFVVKRREDPSFKWNDALGLNLAQAKEILGMDDEDDDQDDDEDADHGEPDPTA